MIKFLWNSRGFLFLSPCILNLSRGYSGLQTQTWIACLPSALFFDLELPSAGPSLKHTAKEKINPHQASFKIRQRKMATNL